MHLHSELNSLNLPCLCLDIKWTCSSQMFASRGFHASPASRRKSKRSDRKQKCVFDMILGRSVDRNHRKERMGKWKQTEKRGYDSDT